MVPLACLPIERIISNRADDAKANEGWNDRSLGRLSRRAAFMISTIPPLIGSRLSAFGVHQLNDVARRGVGHLEGGNAHRVLGDREVRSLRTQPEKK